MEALKEPPDANAKVNLNFHTLCCWIPVLYSSKKTVWDSWTVLCNGLLTTFETCSVIGKTHIKVQHFRAEVTFYLVKVQYRLFRCFLCFSAAVQNITVQWIVLSTFRANVPWSISTVIGDTVVISRYWSVFCSRWLLSVVKLDKKRRSWPWLWDWNNSELWEWVYEMKKLF